MSIYYRTNEFGEELCPTCGKSYFTLIFAHTLQFQDMSVPIVDTQPKGTR